MLRQYLVQGYVLNEKRLRESQRQLADLKRLVQPQAEVATNQELTADQSKALLRVLGDYARALDVLDQYDHQRLRVAPETVAAPTPKSFELTPDNARQAINALRVQFGGSELFGREKDQSFESSVRTIYQSFGGQDMYPSVEEKATNLLYFVVKNHSFLDGNKYNYQKQRHAERSEASRVQQQLNRSVVRTRCFTTFSMTFFLLIYLSIAESKPEDKDVMATLVVNLINGEN